MQFEQERQPLIVPVDGASEETIEALRNEIAQLKSAPWIQRICIHRSPEEIEKIEKQIHEIEAELEHSFTVDSVPLSRLLQLRTTQTDLKSYLRGLKFCAGKSSAQLNASEAHRLRA